MNLFDDDIILNCIFISRLHLSRFLSIAVVLILTLTGVGVRCG